MITSNTTLFALITAADFVTVDGYEIDKITVGPHPKLGRKMMHLECGDEYATFVEDNPIYQQSFEDIPVPAFDEGGELMAVHVQLQVVLPMTLGTYLMRQDVIMAAAGG